MKTLKNISPLALVCALSLPFVSCSEGEIDAVRTTVKNEFHLSNYAFDFRQVTNLGMNSNTRAGMTRADINGNLFCLDANNQKVPLKIRVSDKFIEEPDTVIPADQIGFEYNVVEFNTLGDDYMLFYGDFNFWKNSISKNDSIVYEWNGHYDYNGTLLVHKGTGDIYEFQPGMVQKRRGGNGVDGDNLCCVAADGSMYGVFRGTDNNQSRLAHLTYQKDRSITVDYLLPAREEAYQCEVDKYGNILYYGNRILLKEGGIKELPWEAGYDYFKGPDGSFYLLQINHQEIGVPYNELGYLEYARYPVVSLYQLNAQGENTGLYSRKVMMDMKWDILDIGQKVVNRGNRTFLLGSGRVLMIDFSDGTVQCLSDKNLWPTYMGITETYCFMYQDNTLYRLNFETATLEEDRSIGYTFYDMTPYGTNQVQFHGMRYANGKEVYGIIDEKGNINIVDETGQFGSVTMQPL